MGQRVLWIYATHDATTAAYNAFAPTLFAYYIIELGKLYDSNPNLKRNFRKSPWPSPFPTPIPATLRLDGVQSPLSGSSTSVRAGKSSYRTSGSQSISPLALLSSFPLPSSAIQTQPFKHPRLAIPLLNMLRVGFICGEGDG
jgi:hypothetical protein